MGFNSGFKGLSDARLSTNHLHIQASHAAIFTLTITGLQP